MGITVKNVDQRSVVRRHYVTLDPIAIGGSASGGTSFKMIVPEKCVFEEINFNATASQAVQIFDVIVPNASATIVSAGTIAAMASAHIGKKFKSSSDFSITANSLVIFNMSATAAIVGKYLFSFKFENSVR